nr:hypothetical protein [Mucilaginibacter sp. L294]
MLKAERHYADSVESHPDIIPYYIRRGGYRFTAKFEGSVMPVDKEALASMKRVYKLTGGDLELFANLVDSAVLIKVDDKRIWVPIQKKLLKAFKEEIEKDTDVLLYCAYFNEHTSKKVLYNNFLISEFFKEEENSKE